MLPLLTRTQRITQALDPLSFRMGGPPRQNSVLWMADTLGETVELVDSLHVGLAFGDEAVSASERDCFASYVVLRDRRQRERRGEYVPPLAWDYAQFVREMLEDRPDFTNPFSRLLVTLDVGRRARLGQRV